MADDGIGLAELLGLEGFRVLEVVETAAEVIVTVETEADFTGFGRCGVRAEAQDRRRVHVRELPSGGGSARLVWISAAGGAPTPTVKRGRGRSRPMKSTPRRC